MRGIKVEAGPVERGANEGCLCITLNSDAYLMVGNSRIYLTEIGGSRSKPQIRLLIVADKSVAVTRCKK